MERRTMTTVIDRIPGPRPTGRAPRVLRPAAALAITLAAAGSPRMGHGAWPWCWA